MLLFDALDEVKSNKNVLIKMIKDIIISTKNKVAISVRQENYNDEFNGLAEKYYILPLNDKLISQYIMKNTKHNLNYYTMNLGDQFKLLLSRPLYLYIFVEILNNQSQEQYTIPKNTTLLFDNFYRFPLRQKQISDIEINLTEQILSLYAEWLIENQESNAKLIEYIHQVVGATKTEKYMEIIIKSGIVIQGINGLRFFHNTFLEYFYAKRIVQYDENSIIDFLAQHQNDHRYHEIICFMVGIISNENKQNIVLDYLQEHNLVLFLKALKSRFKFDRSQIDTEYNYPKAYFTQIRNTYLQLIDTYFYIIKEFFFPFIWSSNMENQKLKLIGGINTSNYSISIKLECTDKDDTDVEFSILTSTPQMFVGDDKIPIPILSMSNNGYYFYNLAALSLGLDSAREIAVNMIKEQLFKFIKNKTIFDIGCNILMTECIEDVLDNLRKRRLLPQDLADISLSNNPKKVLEFLFANRDKFFRINNRVINFELLYIYCQMLINSKKDITQFVLPKEDLSTPRSKDKKHIHRFDFYSDEQLVKRIRKIIELTERGYEELVLTHFPMLSDILIKSKPNCCQYIRLNRSGRGWEISKTIISTPTRENKIYVVLNDSVSTELSRNEWRLSDDERDLLKKIGATEKDIISQSYGMMHDYLSENVLHNFIYKRLETDFKRIFEGK